MAEGAIDMQPSFCKGRFFRRSLVFTCQISVLSGRPKTVCGDAGLERSPRLFLGERKNHKGRPMRQVEFDGTRKGLEREKQQRNAG